MSCTIESVAMKLLRFLIIIIYSLKPCFIKTTTIEELDNWFEYIQALSTKCPLKETISDLFLQSKPVFEITNCGDLNDISNYDFKVFSRLEIFTY